MSKLGQEMGLKALRLASVSLQVRQQRKENESEAIDYLEDKCNCSAPKLQLVFFVKCQISNRPKSSLRLSIKRTCVQVRAFQAREGRRREREPESETERKRRNERESARAREREIVCVCMCVCVCVCERERERERGTELHRWSPSSFRASVLRACGDSGVRACTT